MKPVYKRIERVLRPIPNALDRMYDARGFSVLDHVVPAIRGISGWLDLELYAALIKAEDEK